MFKKFEEKESVSSVQQLKSSVQKGEITFLNILRRQKDDVCRYP